MDTRLPSRLFKTDRYPNSRLNVYSKPDLITFVRDALAGTEELSRIRCSPLGVLFDLPVGRCPISCKLLHALICRQLLTRKKYELWMVYGGQPFRFSLAEFRLISGLDCGEFPTGYNFDVDPTINVSTDTMWQKVVCGDKHTTLGDLGELLKNDEGMPGWRKLAIALLILVDGVLIGNHQINRPTPKYVQMLEDVDSFMKFPWGRESFLKTIGTMRPPLVPTKKCPDPVAWFQLKCQQHSFMLQGFPLALQLLAYETIPLLLARVPNGEGNQTFMDTTFVGLPKLTAITMNDVLDIENQLKLSVEPVCPLGLVGYDCWGEWDDEDRDKKVMYMQELIGDGRNFVKEMWPGGIAAKDYVVYESKTANLEHRKHVVDRKGCVATSSSGTKRCLRRKDKKMKKTGTTRKQRKIENFFQPSSDGEAVTKSWVEEKLEGVRQSLLTEIEEQRKEIARLKKKACGRKRSNFKNGWSYKRSVRRKGKEPGGTAEISDNEKAFDTNLEEAFGAEGRNAEGRNEGMVESEKEELTVQGSEALEGGSGSGSRREGNEIGYEEMAGNGVDYGSKQDLMDTYDPPAACGQPYSEEAVELANQGEVQLVNGKDEELGMGSHNGDTDCVMEEGQEAEILALTSEHNLSTFTKDAAACTKPVEAVMKHMDDEDVNKEIDEERREMEAVCAGLEPMINNVVEENMESPDRINAHGRVNGMIDDVGSDEDSNVQQEPVVLSDSSAVEKSERPKPSQTELSLLRHFSNKPRRQEMDLLPVPDYAEFKFFSATLSAFPEMTYVTKEGWCVDSKFLLDLAKPTEWVSTTHMEILFSMLAKRHESVLRHEQSELVSPWFANYLQGKYKSFDKALNKKRIRWGDRIQGYVASEGRKWCEDIKTVYLPMCWEEKHWVGLAIHFNIWAVEVFDSAPNLYKPKEMGELLAPVVKMLPHILDKFCSAELSQQHGVKPFGYKRVSTGFEDKSGGSCGPIAVKYMELHLNGNPSEMRLVTEKMVGDMRQCYAMDIFQELIVPLCPEIKEQMGEEEELVVS